jgi:DNA methylase
MNLEPTHLEIVFDQPFNRLTHYLFRYPAKFHPPVASFLIESFSNPGDRILDPFCGSGTLLVEGAIAGREMYGFDVDPVASFISEVKTTPLKDLQPLREFASRLKKKQLNKGNHWVPRIPNVAHWFEPHVLSEMAALWASINRTQALDAPSRSVAVCAFLSRIRGWSNADPIPVSGLEVTKHIRTKRANGHFPNVKEEYLAGLSRAVEDIAAYSELFGRVRRPDVRSGDSTKLLQRTKLRFDAIITSPPYLSAVDYYRRHTLEMFWLDRKMTPDKRLVLRREYIGQYVATRDNALAGVLLSDDTQRMHATIHNISPPRARAFQKYFQSMRMFMAAAAQRLTPSGTLTLVVGDGTSGGVPVPTSALLAAEAPAGLNLTKTFAYPLKNRYMTYARRNNADIKLEKILVFRRSR